MNRRSALLSVTLALALVVPLSVVAMASSVTAPQPAPATAVVSDVPTITAVGGGLIAGSSADPLLGPQTLYIGAQSKSGPADLEAAAGEMQLRLATIRSAIEKLGGAPASIRPIGINVQPQFGPGGPGEKGGPAPLSGFLVAGNIQVELADARLLVAAINAAIANGASSVNSGVSGKGGPIGAGPQPSAAQLASGMAEALKNARSAAEAIASASGRTLGAVRSVSAQQLYPDCCPQGGGWRVMLTVTFEIAP